MNVLISISLAKSSDAQLDATATTGIWPKVIGGLFAVIVLWLFFVTLSRFLNERRIGHSGLEFLRRYTIPSPSIEISRSAANDRRRRLQGFLNEFPQSTGVPIEFLEVPPELEVAQRRFPEGDASRFWHASRLRLQLLSDHYLLLERVTDALVCLHRAERLDAEEFPLSVRLERIPNARTPQYFPWRVVITASNPTMLKELMLKLNTQYWLGIRIDFVRPAYSTTRKRDQEPRANPPEPTAQPQGRCTQGSDGLEGTVGGLVHDANDIPYGVTCRHVLSSGCASLYWPAAPVRPPQHEFTQESPDAAFIRLGSECFATTNTRRTRTLPATQVDVDFAAERETKVRKSPDTDGVVGVVLFSSVSGFKLGNHFYRGPHFEIAPAFYQKYGLTLPLSRRFSSQGDSGAWVVDAEARLWLGMVVGGFPSPNTLTVALSADHICDAFQRSQATNISAIHANTTQLTTEVFE